MRKLLFRRCKPLYYAMILAACVACSSPKKVNFKLLERHTLQGIPSASGIVAIGDSIFVIGDNTPWIYRINQDFEIASKLKIEGYELRADQIIPKAIKPDFEALEAIDIGGKKELFIFGSGSKSPMRDVLIQVDYEASVLQMHSLEKFYHQLKSSAPLQGYDLNIEAVAITGDRLFLFNRGKNLVFQYSFKAFYAYVTNQSSEYPEPEVSEIILPKIDAHRSGLSGATMLPDGSGILFTASVETNSNPIDDGGLLGSFVGMIPLKALKKRYKPACSLILEHQKTLKIKVESILVLAISSSGEAEVLLVTDSDGGDSEILRGLLTGN